MHRQSSPIIARSDIERVRRLALQRRGVYSSRYPVGLGVGVRVIRSDTESGKKRRKHSEVLQVSKLNSADVRVRSVDDRGCRTCSLARGAQRAGGIKVIGVVNRINELLVEKSALNHAIGLQVMFIQNIEIVGVLRFQTRIP